MYDAYLYRSALRKALPANYSSEDSAAFAQTYLYKWARRQLLLRKALLNLSEEAVTGLEKRVQDYRNDLIIDTYEQYLLQGEVDTLVTEAQLKAYYEAHLKPFNLNEDLVKIRYLILPKTSDKLRQAKALLQRTDTASRSDLAAFASQNAIGYSLQDRTWLKWRRVRAALPLTPESGRALLKKGKRFALRDASGLYLGWIKAVKRRGEPAPLTYVAPVVRKLIRDHRRRSYVNKIENDLLDYATENENFERYE